MRYSLEQIQQLFENHPTEELLELLTSLTGKSLPPEAFAQIDKTLEGLLLKGNSSETHSLAGAAIIGFTKETTNGGEKRFSLASGCAVGDVYGMALCSLHIRDTLLRAELGAAFEIFVRQESLYPQLSNLIKDPPQQTITH